MSENQAPQQTGSAPQEGVETGTTAPEAPVPGETPIQDPSDPAAPADPTLPSEPSEPSVHPSGEPDTDPTIPAEPIEPATEPDFGSPATQGAPDPTIGGSEAPAAPEYGNPATEGAPDPSIEGGEVGEPLS